MTVERAGSRLEALGARAGLSEGQVYTVILLAVVAALLTSSLTGLTGRIAEVAATPLAPNPAEEAVAPATPTTALPDLPGIGLPSAPTIGPPAPSAGPPPFTAPGPTDPLDPDEPPPAVPCDAQPLIDSVRDAVTSLDSLTGGSLPDGTVVSALAVATGCSNTDPAILLLAALIEIGQGLPDLGLGFLELPVLPFLEIPRPVIDLVQPARDVLDPICNTVATLAVITSQVGPSYQPPFNALFSVSMFYALATCGQLQDA